MKYTKSKETVPLVLCALACSDVNAYDVLWHAYY